MKNILNRREFFLGSAATAAGASVLLTPTTAVADYNQPIGFELTGKFKWDNVRRNIIRQAMWVINHRFLDVENVVQNVLNVAPNGYSFLNDAWNNLQPHYNSLKLGDHLLWYQLLTIRNWMSPPDPRGGPKLSILSDFKKVNAFAWGPYNTVTVSGNGERYSVKGDFQVYLNFWFLGAGGLNNDPWSWASTIAHEMLHNLGHMHPEPVTDQRYQRRQINAFTAALYYGNGKYRFGMRTPDVRCGGRRP